MNTKDILILYLKNKYYKKMTFIYGNFLGFK